MHALELDAVSLRLGDPLVDVLCDVTWHTESDQRWVVLGPNGAGKTSLLRIASLYDHPSSGTVRVLGEQLGSCDVRALRTRIGLMSPALAQRLEATMTAAEVVMTARYGALAPWWHRYTDADREHAVGLLARFGIAALADHPFPTLSAGERQKCLLARALARDPELLLLDEPTSGLDIGAREQVLHDLAQIAHDAAAPPSVLVTHHLEEIPPGFTHALVLRAGAAVAQGPIADVIVDDVLSHTYGLSLRVTHDAGRFTARLA